MSQKNKKKISSEYLPPPRGNACVNWVPYSKAKLMERDEKNNRQRLLTAQIAINWAISLVFEIFEINNNNDITLFRIKCDDIIYGIMEGWNNRLLLKWGGITDQNNILERIEWFGRSGYWHKCTNYLDQYKNTVSHLLWIPLFEQLLDFIDKISIGQYGDNQSLVELFKSCLIYSCIYSLFVSEIKFFQCAPRPVVINTALVKNGKIRRWLKTEIDAEITMFKWKEQEMERTNLNKKENKICQRVRVKCIKYIESAMTIKFKEFYQCIGSKLDNMQFNKFKVTVSFDKQGVMKNDKDNHLWDEFVAFDCSPKISSIYFNKQYYFNQNRKNDETEKAKPNKSRPREFQRVSDFGIQNRMNMNGNGDRRSIRKNLVEANIQQIRNNMHLNQLNGYHSPEIQLLLHENYELKREHQLLRQQLSTINVYHISNDSSIASILSSNSCNSCNSNNINILYK